MRTRRHKVGEATGAGSRAGDGCGVVVVDVRCARAGLELNTAVT